MKSVSNSFLVNLELSKVLVASCWQREERVLEVAIDAVLQRVVELKVSLQELLHKLEHEGDSSDWPHYLQQYSVISAQVNQA